MNNIYVDKYSKASDNTGTIASKSIDAVSQSIMILEKSREYIGQKDLDTLLENSRKVSENFQTLLLASSVPELGSFGEEMQVIYFNLSMKHNLFVLEGCKDESQLEFIIDKFRQLKDYWKNLEQLAKNQPQPT